MIPKAYASLRKDHGYLQGKRLTPDLFVHIDIIGPVDLDKPPKSAN